MPYVSSFFLWARRENFLRLLHERSPYPHGEGRIPRRGQVSVDPLKGLELFLCKHQCVFLYVCSWLMHSRIQYGTEAYMSMSEKPKVIRKMRHGFTKGETQGRLLPKKAMPTIRAYEKLIVDAARDALSHEQGVFVWSGRQKIFGRSSGGCQFLPVLGPGTPDLLGVKKKPWGTTQGADGGGPPDGGSPDGGSPDGGWRACFFGIEFKRTGKDRERETQRVWRERASLYGVLVLTECTNVMSALEFVRSI